MSSRVCLRCDWSGSTHSSRCPACGAPLFTSPPEPVAPAAPVTTARSGQPPGPDPGALTRGKPPSLPRKEPGSHLATILTIVAILGALAIVAVVVSGLGRSSSPPADTSPLRLHGTILYAGTTHGSTRLWSWDLARGTVSPGPKVRDAVELVNASGAQPGWVGVTSRTRTAMVGSVLRSLTPGTHATQLVSGDLVSWAPHGDSVASLKREALGGCQRRITIVARELVPSVRHVQLDRRFCGDVLSIGRGAGFTYFTVRRAGSADVVRVGYGAEHGVLSGYTLVGASAANGLMVMPAAGFSSGSQAVGLGSTTSLYFAGLPAPIPLGTEADRLRVDRVLAWKTDAGTALVQGSLGTSSGLFEVGVGPGAESRVPRPMGSVPDVLAATYLADGTVILDTPDGFRALSLDGAHDVALPPGAPLPTGPIVALG